MEKVTDNEIINCLNDTVGKEHIGIYCTDKNGNFTAVVKLTDLVDFINRQKADIERLQSCNKICVEAMGEQEIEIATAKIESIKEYKEKVIEVLLGKSIFPVLVKNALNEAEKEMVGDTNG